MSRFNKWAVLVGAQEIAMYTMLTILLLWLSPALVLAPILAWVMLKNTPGQTTVTSGRGSPSSEQPGASKQGVQA